VDNYLLYHHFIELIFLNLQIFNKEKISLIIAEIN